MYKTDMDEFNRKATEWVHTFAKEVTNDDKILKIVEMGFSYEQAEQALEKADWVEEAAVNELLMG